MATSMPVPLSASYASTAAAAPSTGPSSFSSLGGGGPSPPAYSLSNSAAYSPPTSFSSLGGAGGAPAPLAGSAGAKTRILQLSDFSKDLKTRDIQALFAEWEDERGGFKIKWVDDTTCLIVFADPGVAKRAFLSTLTNMPLSFSSPTPPKLRPYSGPDVIQILTSVQNRPRSRSNASTAVHSRSNSTASTTPVRSEASFNSIVTRRQAPQQGGGKQPSLAQAQVQEMIDSIIAEAPVMPPGCGVGNGIGSYARPPSAASTGSRPSTAGGSPEMEGNGGIGAPLVGDVGKRFVVAGIGKGVNGHGRMGSSGEGSQTDEDSYRHSPHSSLSTSASSSLSLASPPSCSHSRSPTLPDLAFQPFSLRFRSDSHSSAGSNGTAIIVGGSGGVVGGKCGLGGGALGLGGLGSLDVEKGLAGMTIEELPEVVTPRAGTYGASLKESVNSSA